MHPYDAKSNFFSEVDVLRGRQSKGPAAAVFHVSLDFVCVGACGGTAAVVVLSVLLVTVMRLVPHALHLFFLGFVCNNAQSISAHSQKPLSGTAVVVAGGGAVRSTSGTVIGAGGAKHCFN